MHKIAIPTQIVEDAVHLAGRAPSFHNSQPWAWVWDGHELSLNLDRDRFVHSDESGRQALISCGAALDHLRIAAAAAGWTANVDRFPNPNNLDHLATVEFTPLPTVTDGQHRRAEAILRRRTDRLPFAAPTEWDHFQVNLGLVLDDSYAVLDLVSDADLPKLVEASHLAESLRLYDSQYHAELNWWTAPFEVSDGVPHSALLSAAESDRVDVGRTFPVTHHKQRRTDVPEDEARILVISARDNTRNDIMGCGEMLSTVLLEATIAGMATCTLTHMTELVASSGIISEITGRRFPQVLIRVGMAPAAEDVPALTPRRPLLDTLTIRPR
ncbi:MAG: NAD(P)H nitroreductase [Mycobacterium sp.]|nr:NAD(P)H nitroreductase [Mycobacterium sp.]